MPTLIITTRDGIQTQVEVREPFFTLGRSSECTVQVKDRGLSKRHARFYRVAEGYCVIDAGSKNGIRINEKRVDQALLRDGDELRLGKVAIRWLESPCEEHRELQTSARLPDWDTTDLPVFPPAPDEPQSTEAPAATPSAQGITPPDLFKPIEKGLPSWRPPPKGNTFEEPDKPSPVLYPRGKPPVLAPKRVKPKRTEQSTPCAGTGSPAESAARSPVRPGSHVVPAVPSLESGPPGKGTKTSKSAVLEPDAVDAALTRLRAEVPELDQETLLEGPHLRRVKAWVGKAGAGTLVACAAGLLLLGVMTLHSRHLMESRWKDGAPPTARLRPVTEEDLAAVLYRQAEALRSSDDRRYRDLLARLVKEHPQSGWADLARARLAPPPNEGTGPTVEPELDGVVRRLEGALARGRYAEALEGYELLSRTASTEETRAKFARRLPEIRGRMWREYESKRKATVDKLLVSGKREEAIRAAEALIDRYPVLRVREDLERRLK